MRIAWAALLSVLMALQVYPAARTQLSVITCVEHAIKTVPLRSTERLPEASGTAKVERQGGTTEIQIELDSIKPASLFGGDYNTYVLWVVPPGGPAENRGEILLDGDRAKLRASTPAAAFAILISAEPHYLASAPSAFVILENNPDAGARAIEEPLIEGVYNFSRSTLDGAKEATGKVHSEVRQAFTAVRLAQRAGSGIFALDELTQARRALDITLALWHEGKNRTEIAAQAHEAIRLAVAAQRLAHDRALQETPDGTEGWGGGRRDPAGRDSRGLGRDWR